MDRRTQDAIQRLAQELTRVDAKADQALKAKRAPQLGHSSIDSGAMEIRDPESQAVRARIGWLPDGTVGMVTEGGDPVSSPTAPIVTPSLGGLRVTWDGSLSEDLAIPGDFDHMAVHVSTESGFTPSPGTFEGTIRRAGEGGMLPVVPLPYVPHFVVLVPVTTGGIQGTPSAEVSATPLQTSGVDLEADSVAAVHVQAGAIEADKLEAVLALVTTIIAGIPGAARVELDQDGLRGYNESNELIFAIDSAGNAVFSGDITGSEISGSRMVIGAEPGPVGVVEQALTGVQFTATATNNARTQMYAGDEQAEFATYSDYADVNSPSAGFVAAAEHVFFGLNSDNGQAGTPALYGRADATGARFSVQSQRATDAGPVFETTATPTAVQSEYSSGGDGRVLIYAEEAYTSVFLQPETAEGDLALGTAGALYAHRTAGAPVVSLQSAVTDAALTDGARRSLIYMQSASPAAPYTETVYGARQHSFSSELLDGTSDTSPEGRVHVYGTHSIAATRHRPIVARWLGVSPTVNTAAEWVNFTATQWERPVFRAPASGMVRVDINAYGINSTTASSILNVGFFVTGYPGDRSRSVEIRSTSIGDFNRQGHYSDILTLNPNASYTLVPQWRISSGTWGSNLDLSTTGPNNIIITPQT